MRIAVFGWYGHENAGDERIKYCLGKFLKELGGINEVNFFDLHENAIKGKISTFDEYDLVIIGGGGLILSQHNYHEFIRGINTKLMTVGVSVETELKGNPEKFAKALIEKSLVFLVRDQGSYDKLKYMDLNNKVKVSSDLTFLEPYDLTQPSLRDKVGINLLPLPLKNNFSKLNVSFISFLQKYLEYFKLYQPKVVCFNEAIKRLSVEFELLPIPFYCYSNNTNNSNLHKNDVEFLKQYFPAVPNTFNHHELDKCKIFISMRFHGAIFSVQKGIPVITFSIFPKHINFMKELGLEKLLVDINSPDTIQEILCYIDMHAKEINEKMILYREKSILQIRRDLIEAMNLL